MKTLALIIFKFLPFYRAMSSEENGVIGGMEQAKADANLQFAMSLLNPFLVKLILSNPIMKKKLGDKKTDFSQSLQAIIEDWSLFYPPGSKFVFFQTYFSRAKKVRHWVAHQSFDRNRYQHCMECLANVATAIGKPDLADIILNLVAVQQDKRVSKEEKNQMNVLDSLKEDEWTSLKQEANQLFEKERWEEAMNCYTRAIHLNQQEAALYSNRALCELHLSKFDLAREDIEDAIQLDPKNVKYFRVLSEVLLEMKMHRESLAACLQGLELDPRDEVLIIRERDCGALIASDSIRHGFDKSSLGETKEKNIARWMEEFRRIKNLPLTSEDIKECPDLHTWNKITRISDILASAFKLANGSMPSSTRRIQEEQAFKIFESGAEKGSAFGLLNMALFYSEGKAGLPRDFYKATELFRKAALQKPFIRFQDNIIPNQGVTEAECFLGNCYRDGRGVDRSKTKAFEWYLKSAGHHSSNGQAFLGLALLNGDGCKKNETSARSWFQKAAEGGDAGAQYIYGTMLEEGRGGPIDTKKAAEMLQLAADQGASGALERLQNLSMSGAIGASNMQQTKEILKKSAEEGNPESLFLLGQNYRNGTGGFEKDPSQAERYLAASSKAGYKEAHFQLGKLLLELEKNEEAFEFIKLAAEEGSADGQLELGILLAYGHGCVRDEAKARRWLNRAGLQGLSLKVIGRDEEDKSTDDWVEVTIDNGRETSKFETQHHLTPDGMSIQKRKIRFMTSKLDIKGPASSSFLELREILSTFPTDGRPSPTPTIRRGMTRECIDELLSIEAAKEALDHNPEDADALYVLARCTKTYPDEEKLRMAKRCVELDPSVPDFHHFLCIMLRERSNAGALKNGLRAIDRAIELLPNHPSWLFNRADLIRLIDEGAEKKTKHIYSAEAVEAYMKFISSNPMDHQHFPVACYLLAHIYAFMREYSKAKTYYLKGQDAEDPRVRLPCFEPVKDDHLAIKTTRMLLNAWELGMKLPQ